MGWFDVVGFAEKEKRLKSRRDNVVNGTKRSSHVYFLPNNCKMSGKCIHLSEVTAVAGHVLQVSEGGEGGSLASGTRETGLIALGLAQHRGYLGVVLIVALTVNQGHVI